MGRRPLTSRCDRAVVSPIAAAVLLLERSSHHDRRRRYPGSWPLSDTTSHGAELGHGTIASINRADRRPVPVHASGVAAARWPLRRKFGSAGASAAQPLAARAKPVRAPSPGLARPGRWTRPLGQAPRCALVARGAPDPGGVSPASPRPGCQAPPPGFACLGFMMSRGRRTQAWWMPERWGERLMKERAPVRSLG